MKRIILCVGTVALAAFIARADWSPADGHKMHFPQLPDLDGWDVYAVGNNPNPAQQKMLADDWTCSQTGPVTDIHFWGSWKNGNTGVINSFTVSIWSNVVNGPNGFSTPGELLWEETLSPTSTVPIDPPTMQGWFDPNTGQFTYPDHSNFFQYNILLDPLAPNLFHQVQGQVYWLGISANIQDPTGTAWGWKTADVNAYPEPFTGNHYLDDAVWGDLGAGGLPQVWNELIDPQTGASLDLAFVITPEPGAVALVLFGAALLGLRRRRRLS